MIINKTIIPLQLNDFNTGKILRYPQKDFLFLFDLTHQGMVQLSSSYEVMKRIMLTDILKIDSIDSVFFDEGHLILTDSISRKLYRLNVEFDPAETITLRWGEEYPLKTGSIIVAGLAYNDRYLLLDKGYSSIRVLTKDFKEEIMIGSRMGYIHEYSEEEKPRLGFEYPEDIAAKGEHILVSDSGNKRIVALNREFKQEKIIKLPGFPYKIISWMDDRVIVSDFDRSLMVVSLPYGYIHTQEIDYPVDFFQTVYHPLKQYCGSENRQRSEIVELTFPAIPLETIAEEAGNYSVLMKINVDRNKLHDARELVKKHDGLLPDYVNYTTDNDGYILNRLTEYVNKTVQTVKEENNVILKDLSGLALEFIKKYKSIPNSDDVEAANIDKEHIRRRMFLKIKQYRGNLKKLVDTRYAVRKYPDRLKSIERLLAERFEILEASITKSVKEIEESLHVFDEQALLGFIVEYWILSEEERTLFKDKTPRFIYERLFGNKFILAILNDFYYNIAQLFLKKNRIDQYIAFADREISMYTDKLGIFKQFCEQLIVLGKYDDVLRMLKKFPDQNKENVNYFYYRVCLAKGDMDGAFIYLKKELDLYTHRVDLIPQLIKLNKLDEEDTRRYIEKIIEKSAQSIDAHLHAAKSYLNAGDYEKAEYYVDRELELFPENKEAVSTKHELYTKKIDRTQTVPEPGYFRKTWDVFKAFMKVNRDELFARRVVSFFTALNHITPDPVEIAAIKDLREKTPFEFYKKEFDVYLSFMAHFRGAETRADIGKYSHETYLSAYSTGEMAYRYFFEEVKRLKDTGKWNDMFDLTERILKYNPGAEDIFKYLDSLL